MKYRKKPVVIEAITFGELVKYGKANGGNIVNGMPWSFAYVVTYRDEEDNEQLRSHPITHENDECYLIPTLEGSMRFTPADMLITGVKGEIYPCKRDIFEATYDLVEMTPEEADRAYDEAPADPLSEEEIERMVQAAVKEQPL